MEIQTLTKRQLKSTLSEKKFKSKDVIKNILSTPYKSTFWYVNSHMILIWLPNSIVINNANTVFIS